MTLLLIVIMFNSTSLNSKVVTVIKSHVFIVIRPNLFLIALTQIMDLLYNVELLVEWSQLRTFHYEIVKENQLKTFCETVCDIFF